MRTLAARGLLRSAQDVSDGGLAVALALGRTAQSLLFGLAPHDPVVVIGSVVVLSLVALGAGFLPALRASRIDPMAALRYE